MINNQNAVPNPRRSFLTKLAGAMGVSAFIHQTGLRAAEPTPAEPDAWVAKINGKHKMVFDVPQPHGIFAFAWPKVFLLTNQATGTPEKETNSVVVLRHDGIGYAMEDKLWAKYKLGEHFKVNDHRNGQAAVRNPMWKPNAGEFKVPGLGAVPIGINELQDSGVIFCVCDMALTVNAYTIAGKMNMDGAEVKKDFVAGILPGINIVPSGLWALGRAQEKGCGYCFAG